MNKNFFIRVIVLALFGIAINVQAEENTVLLPPNMSLSKDIAANSGAPTINTTTVKSISLPKDNVTNSPTTTTTNNNEQNSRKSDENKQPVNSTIGPISESLSNQAFLGVLNKQLPMTPEQISNLRKAFDDTQRVAATPPAIPPRPTTSSILVNLSPSSVPPIIRLGAGYISSLVFIDSTGQPWPIEAYSVGDPGSFNIQWDKKGNTLLIQATSFYKRSNLAVILKNLNMGKTVFYVRA